MEHIRKFEHADIKSAVQIEEQVFKSDVFPHVMFKNLLNIPGCVGLVIEKNNQIIGHILAMVVIDEAEILTFAIDPAFQKQGMGEKLLNNLLSNLKNNKVVKVSLEVRVSNIAAKQLYEKIGGICSGMRKNYYAPYGELPAEDASVYCFDLSSEI